MRETDPQPTAAGADAPTGAPPTTAAVKPRPNSGAVRWRFATFSGLGDARARIAGPVNLFRMRHVRLS